MKKWIKRLGYTVLVVAFLCVLFDVARHLARLQDILEGNLPSEPKAEDPRFIVTNYEVEGYGTVYVLEDTWTETEYFATKGNVNWHTLGEAEPEESPVLVRDAFYKPIGELKRP